MGRADTGDRQDDDSSQPQRVTGRGPVARAATGPALGAVLVVVAVLAGGLILRNLPADSGPGSSPTPSVEASPSLGPSPSAPEPTASPSEAPTPSPAPTPLPSVVISGHLPGPGATVPPGYVVMPVGIEEFAATAMALGLVCAETFRETGFGVGDYGLECPGAYPSAHAEVSTIATFWTLDGLWLVTVLVGANEVGGSVTDPTLPARIIVPFATLLGGEAAGDWALDKLDDPTCPAGGCKRLFGDVLLYVSQGSHGFATFHASMVGEAYGG